MKPWLFCLLLGVLPGLGKDRDPDPVPVSLYTKFEHPVSPRVQAAIQQELTAIMDPVGITFDWRSLASADGSQVSVELAVVTFKGECSMALPRPHSSNPGSLGWTHISDGVILPFSDVDCNRIRQFLQGELMHRDPAVREALFGRAVARVLAHELYHIFGNTSHHGNCGVGKAAYSVQELLTDDFRFEDRETKVMRARSRTLVEMPPPSIGGS